MGETVHNFRCQRARAVRRFGFDGETFRNHQSFAGRGRQSDFFAKLDFRQSFSALRRADQRIARFWGLFYFVLAFLDVAVLPETNFYQSIIEGLTRMKPILSDFSNRLFTKNTINMRKNMNFEPLLYLADEASNKKMKTGDKMLEGNYRMTYSAHL